jgi:hypothetical protein
MIHVRNLFEGLCFGLDIQIVFAPFSITVALKPITLVFSRAAHQNSLIHRETVKFAFKVSTSFVPLRDELMTVF